MYTNTVLFVKQKRLFYSLSWPKNVAVAINHAK